MKTSTLLLLAAAVGVGVYYITTKDKKQAVTAPQAQQPGNAPAAIAQGEPSPAAPVTDPNLIPANLKIGATIVVNGKEGTVKQIDYTNSIVSARFPNSFPSSRAVPFSVISKVY